MTCLHQKAHSQEREHLGPYKDTPQWFVRQRQMAYRFFRHQQAGEPDESHERHDEFG